MEELHSNNSGEKTQAVWFTSPRSVVGVIRVIDDITNEKKYYISAVTGQSIVSDIEYVRQWGATFPAEAGASLFGDIAE